MDEMKNTVPMDEVKIPVPVVLTSGITVAVLSCLKDGNPWTVMRLVSTITEAGRRTSQQELAGVMVTLQKSDVKNMLEVSKEGKAYTYRLKEPYTKADLLELRNCYLKRVKNFSHKNLLEKYGPAEAPPVPSTNAVSAFAGVVEEAATPRVVLVEVSAGEVVTIIVRGKSL